MTSPSFQRRLFRQVAVEILTMLDGSGTPAGASRLNHLGVHDWKKVCEFLFIQGVGPYLYREQVNHKTRSVLPVPLTAWLEKEYSNNAKRIERLHGDLHAFLMAANKSGIEVMPLKGSLLTYFYYPDPALRPMADIDLLIHSRDRRAVHGLMNKSGYAHIPSPSIYPNHDFYLNAGGEKIVNWVSEDANNPRPFEIHTVIRRPLWGNIGVVDLTEMMWKDSYVGELLGEPVWLPSRRALIQHLTIHAMQHFVNASGRILMWLDLAVMEVKNRDLEQIEQIHLVYPILRLAQRALPRHFSMLDLTRYSNQVDAKIRRWCEQVSLDDRCGLIHRTTPENGRLRLSLTRWRPEPWRLYLAYGNIAYLHALILHAAAMLKHFPHRAR